MTEPGVLEIGQVVTRREAAAVFGGAIGGGIQPSRSTPNVLVYPDPEAGSRYGYDFDSWSGSTFLYTGEGREGDQELKSGNKAVVDHVADGRRLRV